MPKMILRQGYIIYRAVLFLDRMRDGESRSAALVSDGD